MSIFQILRCSVPIIKGIVLPRKGILSFSFPLLYNFPDI